MAWRTEGEAPQSIRALDLPLFFGLYVFLIVMLRLWSQLLARRVRNGVRGGVRRGMRYFNRVNFTAQFFVPVWLGIGIFFLSWGPGVQKILGPLAHWPVQVPGAIIGTLPALLAWMGLWWSHYPADRALRDQSLLVRLD